MTLVDIMTFFNIFAILKADEF